MTGMLQCCNEASSSLGRADPHVTKHSANREKEQLHGGDMLAGRPFRMQRGVVQLFHTHPYTQARKHPYPHGVDEADL